MPDLPSREQIERGAAALTATEPAPMCCGDVLHDHDWTPMGASEAVLRASGLVELAAENARLKREVEQLRTLIREYLKLRAATAPNAYHRRRAAADALHQAVTDA